MLCSEFSVLIHENLRSVWDDIWDSVVDIADDIGGYLEETANDADDLAEELINGFRGIDYYITEQGWKPETSLKPMRVAGRFIQIRNLVLQPCHRACFENVAIHEIIFCRRWKLGHFRDNSTGAIREQRERDMDNWEGAELHPGPNRNRTLRHRARLRLFANWSPPIQRIFYRSNFGNRGL